MAGKYKELAEVLKQECIAPDIYSMWLQTDKIAEQAVPGQFISVYSNDGSRLLPRPISLCEIDKDKKALRIVYRVAGKGTAEFAQCQKGDKLEILGPLGNGFPMERAEGKKVFLIGGGIGIPPMVELSRQLPGEKTVIAGYRDDKLFLKEELDDIPNLHAHEWLVKFRSFFSLLSLSHKSSLIHKIQQSEMLLRMRVSSVINSDDQPLTDRKSVV